MEDTISNELMKSISKLEKNMFSIEEELKALQKSVKDLKFCIVCKIRGRAVLCTECNFKSCKKCNVSCMICKTNKCLDCIGREKKLNNNNNVFQNKDENKATNILTRLCMKKNCKFYVCYSCLISEKTKTKFFEVCYFCKGTFCQKNHSVNYCFCRKFFCQDCSKKCKTCKSICCIRCINAENQINQATFYCQHQKHTSILVGCYHGKVLEFNSTIMNFNNEFLIGGNECLILNILTLQEKLVAGLCEDNMIKVWKNRDLSLPPIKEIEVNFQQEIKQVYDDLIVVAAYDALNSKCLVIDTNSGLVINSINFREIWPNTLCKFSESYFLVGLSNGIVKVWDMKRNKINSGFNIHSGKCVNSILKLNNTNHLASSGKDGVVRLWDLTERFEIDSIFSIKGVNVVNNNSSKLKQLMDGRLICSLLNNSISLIDLKSYDKVFLKGHYKDVYDYFQLTDNILFSCGADHALNKWDLRNLNKPISTFQYITTIGTFEN